MENASKALLMAGGMLLTILVVSLFMLLMTSVKDYYEGVEEQKRADEIADFNLSYTNFARDDLLGYELLSLMNKVIDYNQLESVEGYNTDSPVGNRSQASPIEVDIIIWGGDKYRLTATKALENISPIINIPPVEGQSEGKTFNTNSLFQNKIYRQSDRFDSFKHDILDPIAEIEGYTEEDQFDYGGADGLKNIIKNIHTIFEANIINYNEGTPTSTWYEASFVVEKYEKLTGVSYKSQYESATDRDEYNKLCRDIIKEWRTNEENLKNIAQYYEYMQFQKAIFDCTDVEYNDDTGKVSKMTFEFTGLIE